MKKKGQCPYCKGTGKQPKQSAKAPAFKCHNCNGSGKRKHFEMIFWRYDQFPFLIASPGFLEDNGMAYVPAYQRHFRPIKVLPLDEGKALWNEMECLQWRRDLMLKSFNAGWKARLNRLAPWRKAK